MIVGCCSSQPSPSSLQPALMYINNEYITMKPPYHTCLTHFSGLEKGFAEERIEEVKIGVSPPENVSGINQDPEEKKHVGWLRAIF